MFTAKRKLSLLVKSEVLELCIGRDLHELSLTAIIINLVDMLSKDSEVMLAILIYGCNTFVMLYHLTFYRYIVKLKSDCTITIVTRFSKQKRLWV